MRKVKNATQQTSNHYIFTVKMLIKKPMIDRVRLMTTCPEEGRGRTSISHSAFSLCLKLAIMWEDESCKKKLLLMTHTQHCLEEDFLGINQRGC